MDFDLRDACGDDLSFIYSTWLESYRYDSFFGKSHRNGVFFPDYQLVLDKLLEESRVVVACVPDSPETILGYIVFEPNLLHYIFVKGAFRRFGIATSLLDYAFPNLERSVCFTHKTYTAFPFIAKHTRLTYRATALLKSNQGEENVAPEKIAIAN